MEEVMAQFDAKCRILPAGIDDNTIKPPSGQPKFLSRFLNQDTQNKKAMYYPLGRDVWFFKQPCLIGLGNYI